MSHEWLHTPDCSMPMEHIQINVSLCYYLPQQQEPLRVAVHLPQQQHELDCVPCRSACPALQRLLLTEQWSLERHQLCEEPKEAFH